MARVNWMERVQRCSRADLTLRQTNRCRGPQEVKDICRTLLDLIHNAPVFQSDAFHPLSSEASEKREISENLLWAPVILSPGTFLDRPGAFISKASTQTPEESRPTDTKAVAELDFEDDVWPRMLDDPGNETYQLLAKLHTLFGVTSKDIFDPTHRLHSWRYVYDFDNYGFHNRFGPFMVSPKTGLLEINWVHIRAIHHAMSMHVLPGTLPEADEHSAEAQQLTYVIYPLSTPFTQNLVVPSMKVAGLGEAGLDFAEGYLSAGMDKGEREKYLKKNDWAGVEGLWECSFCFVDHRGLLEYNTCPAHHSDAYENSPPPVPCHCPEFHEIFRTLPLQLRVTSISPAESVEPSEGPRTSTVRPGPSQASRSGSTSSRRKRRKPRIHFVGEMGSVSVITGWVQMMSCSSRQRKEMDLYRERGEEGVRWDSAHRASRNAGGSAPAPGEADQTGMPSVDAVDSKPAANVELGDDADEDIQDEDGEYVQWHFVSGEAGNATWSSEGIQVGGIRSLFGVLGTWTTVFHEDDDPVGPFWLRRRYTDLPGEGESPA